MGSPRSELAQRVVLTGASGFAGRAVLEALTAAGVDVAVVIRRGSTWTGSPSVHVIEDSGRAADLASAFADWGPVTCVHLAALCMDRVRGSDLDVLTESNFGLGMRVADAFARSGGEVFLYSSSYFQRRDSARYSPTNLYAATKHAFGQVLRHYAEAREFKVWDVQLYDVYGSDDPRPKVWRALMQCMVSGTPFVTSPGGQLLSPVHVDDVGAGFTAAVTSLRASEPWWQESVMPGPEVVQLRWALERLISLSGSDVDVVWGGRPYTGNEMFSFWQHAPVLRDWQPRVDLDEGFSDMWTRFASAAQRVGV